ncbi:MAG: hypothetical protein AAF740_13625, partial [Bacteroidota bacterium]
QVVEWFISADKKSRLYYGSHRINGPSIVILTRDTLQVGAVREAMNHNKIDPDNIQEAVIVDKLKSVRGIRLGMSLEEAEEILGSPSHNAMPDIDKRVLGWAFELKLPHSGIATEGAEGLKPFIIESENKYWITLYFDRGKLSKAIYEYELPSIF